MLQKLVVEFHDELEALGVRVDDIEGKVNLLDSRLGGWKLSGELRLDLGNESANRAPAGDGFTKLSRARLHFDRWFGDPENPMHFRATLRGDNGNGEQGAQNWKQFYVEVPFVWDTLLTVGRSGGDFGADYYLGGTTGLPNTGGYAGLDSSLTDRDLDKLQVEKQFGMGKVTAYVAHPTESNLGSQRESYSVLDTNNILHTISSSTNYSAWELFLMGKFQFNEQFGFDLGAQAFKGDNAEDATVVAGTGDATKTKFNDMWTIFAGLRFNFNENVAFKGIFYHQKRSIDFWLGTQSNPANTAWREWDEALTGVKLEDTSNHWRLIVDVKQEALKFTSLWLEYGQYGEGYISPAGINGAGSVFVTKHLPNSILADMKYWRVGLGQTWSDKWATHLFYYGYKWDEDIAGRDDKMSEWGLGVQYTFNPNVKFGLNFVQADNGVDGADKDNVVRFRTQVTF